MESTTSPALLNELILDTIFGFSEFNCIKTLRLVCRRWNVVAEPLVRKFSKIVLTPIPRKNFHDFWTTFGITPTESPFTDFKFMSGSDDHCERCWHCTVVDFFCEKWKDKIKHLEFNRVRIQTELVRYVYGSFNTKYEINPSLQSNLTTLKLNCTKGNVVVVSLDYLTSIKVLHLKNGATLDIGTNGSKIAPEEIFFTNFYCIQNKKPMGEILLNDIIDFSHMKKLSVHQDPGRYPNVSLDMTTAITVNILFLSRVKILGGSDNNWTVNEKLHLNRIPWTEENQMKFKTLEFQTAAIDISTLPQEIEQLVISIPSFEDPDLPRLRMFYSDPEPPILPNLTFVSLNVKYFPDFFINCPKLTDVHFANHVGEFGEGPPANMIHIDFLPKSLQRIEIKPNTHNIGDGVFEVGTLIVGGWFPDICVREYIKIKPKRLVMVFSNLDRYSEKFFEEVDNFEMYDDMEIYMGPVKLDYDDYLNNDFIKHVDRTCVEFLEPPSYNNDKQYWFWFKNSFGHAISQLEFDTIASLSCSNLTLPKSPIKKPKRKKISSWMNRN